jgi:N-acyl-phosphatidylethanolamine-hydrolysing phospholipase D
MTIHFGTFIGSENESLKAIIEFEKGREDRGMLRLDEQAVDGRGRAGIINIGKSLAVEIGVHDATVYN